MKNVYMDDITIIDFDKVSAVKKFDNKTIDFVLFVWTCDDCIRYIFKKRADRDVFFERIKEFLTCKKVEEKSINELFSHSCLRVRKRLKSLNIETIEQLVNCSPAELLSARDFGQVSLDEIRNALANAGLSLKEFATDGIKEMQDT